MSWVDLCSLSDNSRTLAFSHDGGQVLFQNNENITLRHGIVTGIVGVNGAGKTSLARLIASKDLPGFPKQLVIEYIAASDDEELLAAYIAASTTNENSTVLNLNTLNLKPIEYIDKKIEQRLEQLHQEISSLEAKMEGSNPDMSDLEEDANQLSQLYELEESIQERKNKEMYAMFEKIGFSTQLQKKTLSQLSSGWRYKCRLAAAFLVHPDILIIDEPSFLDQKSTQWFVEQTTYTAETDNAIVLLISHKEAMLDILCENILYINSGNQTLYHYHCGYSTFRSTHENEVQHANKQIAGAESNQQAVQKTHKKIQSDLRKHEKNYHNKVAAREDKRFIKGKCKEAKQKADKVSASRLRQAKKKVEELEETARQKARTEHVKPLSINGIQGVGNIVSLQDVTASYDCPDGDQEVVFEYVDVAIDATDKILLNGVNGFGKSLLVKIIMGEIEPMRGSVKKTGNVIYFPQTALSDLLRTSGDANAVAFLGGIGEETSKARKLLGDFGLTKNQSLQPIRTLSAGQRVRLWLAREQLMHPKPCLLIVDEISENVDRETRDSLVQLLSNFEAAVLVISHDPDFCEGFRPTKVWELCRYGVREVYEIQDDT